jgi:site-specific recombinase XerC
MINRNNKQFLDDYLQFRDKNERLDPKSVKLERSVGLHYLYWCGELDFRNAPQSQIHFVDYVDGLMSQKGTPLSPEYKRKLVKSARRFFEWLSIHKKGFRSITPAWLSTFIYRVYSKEFNDDDMITEDEMRIIADLPVENLIEQRVRAGACFLYLSGMRISAFISMPIKAVNLNELEVRQSPELGIRTKNKKSATTHILDLDAIMNNVQEWDAIVRSKLSPTGFWFAPLSSITGDLDTFAVKVGEHRPRIFRKDLKEWLNKNKTLLHSPHDFRRGHASFLWERAMDFNDLMAIKDNLMQKNLTTTELYVRKQKAQTKKLIQDISNRKVTQEPSQDKDIQFNQIMQRMDSIEQFLRNKDE